MDQSQCAAYLRSLHLGAAKAIKGPELARALGVTNRELQELANALRRDGVPVASNSDGYFYAETAQEVRATIGHMKRRISGIAAAIRGLERARAQFASSRRKGGDGA